MDEFKIFDDDVDIGEIDPENMKDCPTLQTSEEKCCFCEVGVLKPDREPTVLVVYDRDGPHLYNHQPMRCNFLNKYKVCRAGQSYGF